MDKIKKIISDIFTVPIEDVELDMTSEDIEKWDSLGQLILINNIEKEFNVTLDLEDIFKIICVGDIHKVLKTKGVDV